MVEWRPMALDAEILLDWFGTHGRKLPWREPGCTAWGVLVSEIMLQQMPASGLQPLLAEGLGVWGGVWQAKPGAGSRVGRGCSGSGRSDWCAGRCLGHGPARARAKWSGRGA